MTSLMCFSHYCVTAEMEVSGDMTLFYLCVRTECTEIRFYLDVCILFFLVVTTFDL